MADLLQVYLDGIRVPSTAVTITYSIGQLSTAQISVAPSRYITDFVAWTPVQIRYLDEMLWDGMLVSCTYNKTPQRHNAILLAYSPAYALINSHLQVYPNAGIPRGTGTGSTGQEFRLLASTANVSVTMEPFYQFNIANNTNLIDETFKLADGALSRLGSNNFWRNYDLEMDREFTYLTPDVPAIHYERFRNENQPLNNVFSQIQRWWAYIGCRFSEIPQMKSDLYNKYGARYFFAPNLYWLKAFSNNYIEPSDCMQMNFNKEYLTVTRHYTTVRDYTANLPLDVILQPNSLANTIASSTKTFTTRTSEEDNVTVKFSTGSVSFASKSTDPAYEDARTYQRNVAYRNYLQNKNPGTCNAVLRFSPLLMPGFPCILDDTISPVYGILTRVEHSIQPSEITTTISISNATPITKWGTDNAPTFTKPVEMENTSWDYHRGEIMQSEELAPFNPYDFFDGYGAPVSELREPVFTLYNFDKVMSDWLHYSKAGTGDKAKWSNGRSTAYATPVNNYIQDLRGVGHIG